MIKKKRNFKCICIHKKKSGVLYNLLIVWEFSKSIILLIRIIIINDRDDWREFNYLFFLIIYFA